MARSRSSSGYFRGAGMLCILPLDQSLHQTRGDSLVFVPMSVTATPEIHKRIVGVLRFYLHGEDD